MKCYEFVNGVLIAEHDLPDPPQQPLDPMGVAMTLLAVTGTVTVEDAANAAHLTPNDLIAEAEAWAAAAKQGGN